MRIIFLLELYNIGWHWGLYENILHASWQYSPSRYGEVNIIMTNAVYLHTTWNKAIQYYYYYIIWSWLYSEILTILMYTVYVHWCKLTSLTLSSTLSSGSDKLVLAYQLLSRKLLLHLHLLQLLNICTLRGCLIFGDSYELFSVKASENSM